MRGKATPSAWRSHATATAASAADQSAGGRKDSTLDRGQSHEPPASGTERRSDRQLTRAAFRAREHQACDIGADDEQQERRRSQQDSKNRPNGTDGVVKERREIEKMAGMDDWETFAPAAHEHVHLPLRGLEGDAVGKPADDVGPM